MESYSSESNFNVYSDSSVSDSPQQTGVRQSTSVKCRYFMNSGYCFYGDACQFVHVSANGEQPPAAQGQLYTEDDSAFQTSQLAALSYSPATSVSNKRSVSSGKHRLYSTTAYRTTNGEEQSKEMLQQQFRRMRLMQQNVDNEASKKKIKNPNNLPPLQFSQHKSDKTSYFMSQQMRTELQKQRTVLLSNAKEMGLPEHIENYHSLYALEDLQGGNQGQRLLGYSSSCYRVMNSKDGLHYCMRRIHSFRLLNPKAVNSVEQWKKVINSNVVQLKEAFTTKAFGDISLVFIYAYFPGAETLMNRHFTNARSPVASAWQSLSQSGASPQSKKKTQKVMPERLIWSYVIQLTAAVRQIHQQGLTCRVLDPTKVLLIGNSRLRINCCGILDVLASESDPSSSSLISHYQQEDLVSLGKLILALACYSIDAIHRENMQHSIEFVTRNYSNDLKTLIWHLLSSQITSNPHNINEVMPVIGARFYSQLDSTQSRCDLLESELSKEIDNGRLLRILAKLGTILERSEFSMDPEWSETGDRYLLKLFRDYLFHQVTETGNAWIDFAHIVSVLNKLDAGSSERICLSSRDEQSILVVSYHDLKACLETAFSELIESSEMAVVN